MHKLNNMPTFEVANDYMCLLFLLYWCPLKVRSIVPMCPQCLSDNIVDTFSKSKPLNQKA